MRKGDSDETMTLEEYWTLARRDGQWMVLSIEQRAEGDHQLDEPIVVAPWSDDQRLEDEAVTELAVADALPEGFTTADLAEVDFAGDARARALDLSVADGRFAPDVLEAAARRAVAAWAEAVDGDDAPLEAVATPEAVGELLYGGDATRKTRLVVRGPRVKAIHIEAVHVEQVPATMTVGVELGGSRYVEDRDTTTVVSGSKDSAPPSPSAGRSRSTGRPIRPGGSLRRCKYSSVRGTRKARRVPDISVAATAPSARFALPSDRQYLAGRHVWAQIEDGIVTVGVTAPLGEVLWYTPDVEFWAVDRVDVGETLATVQGRSGRTVAVGSPVRGTLVELNPLLRRAPHALLAQPYGRGWVARISADRWERDEAAMVHGARLPEDSRRGPRARARVLLRRRAARPAPGRARRAGAGRGLGALDARAHDLVLGR